MSQPNNDALRELEDFLAGSFEQFLRANPHTTTSSGCKIAAQAAMAVFISINR